MSPIIIVVDGPDNSGKSTLINKLLNNTNFKLIDFPKKINGKCISIGTDNDKALVETLYKFLDPNFIYILDRGYPSNIIYSGFLRGEMDPFEELKDWEEFKEEFNVIEVILTRNPLDEDFEDDLIKLTKDEFNMTIRQYETHFKNVFKILNHDGKNNLLNVDTVELKRLNGYINYEVSKRNALQRPLH